jgi:hypothetical protein
MVTSDTNQHPSTTAAQSKSREKFLLKEFEALRQEHDALDARFVTIIQYLLLFSGAIYSFLLSQKLTGDSERLPFMLVWSVPTIASFIGLIVLLGIAFKVDTMDIYIQTVETELVKSAELGWEHFRLKKNLFRRGRVLFLIPPIGAAILLANFAAAWIGVKYTSMEPLVPSSCQTPAPIQQQQP